MIWAIWDYYIFARGQLQAALDQTRLHIAHAEKIGFIAEYNRGLRNLGIILVYFQDYEQALEVLKSNEEYFEQRGLREGYMIDLYGELTATIKWGKRQGLAEYPQGGGLER